MALMVYTFSDVYTKVSQFLGLGDSPTGDDLTRVKDLVYRGYLSFLMPVNMTTGETYVWDFLNKEASVTLSPERWEYPLPEDYYRISRSPEYTDNKRYPKLTKCSVSTIMNMRNNLRRGSYPTHFAIRPRNYDPKVAPQGKDLIFYPTPGEDYVMTYSYMFIPEKPVNDGDYFIGGPLESEAILQSCLAAAEFDQDEKEGVHAKNATKLIQQLILSNQTDAPDTVGTLHDGNLYARNYRQRPFEIYGSQTSVFGVDL